MKSVAVIEPGRIELVDIPNPDPGPYEAIIKTEVSFLCNATDRKIIDGHFPGIERYPATKRIYKQLAPIFNDSYFALEHIFARLSK